MKCHRIAYLFLACYIITFTKVVIALIRDVHRGEASCYPSWGGPILYPSKCPTPTPHIIKHRKTHIVWVLWLQFEVSYQNRLDKYHLTSIINWNKVANIVFYIFKYIYNLLLYLNCTFCANIIYIVMMEAVDKFSLLYIVLTDIFDNAVKFSA